MKQKLHHKKKRGSLYEPLILLYEMNLDININYRLSQNNSVEGKGQDRYFVYGQDQKVSFEEVIQAVAQYEVDQSNFLTELNQAATNFLTNLQSSTYSVNNNKTIQDKTDKNLGRSLYEFIGNKNFGNFNTDELNQINELTQDILERNVAETLGFNYDSLTKEQQTKLIEQLNTIYAAAGVSSAEEFITQFNTTLNTTKQNDGEFSNFLRFLCIEDINNFFEYYKNAVSSIVT